jgi:hypothetical protein
MSSITQIDHTRTAFSVLLGIVLFGLVVAAATASGYYLPGASADTVLIGP